MKKSYLLPLLLIPALAYASSIKTWVNGEKVNAADLNTNFSHIHNNMVGGHGGRLVDADVASNAAIASNKLAAYPLLPRAFARVGLTAGSVCLGAAAAGTACTVTASSQVTSVTTTGTTGTYRVNLAYTPADANYAVLVTAHYGATVAACAAKAAGGAGGPFATTAPHFLVECRKLDGTTNLADVEFSVLVMD
jgi:hypothetical protein